MMDRTQSTTFQAVEDWLRSLGLLHYAQKFYDNGYEDIDTCKLIKEEDLNAIDITIERDRQDILIAVIKLQQNIYFELEPDNNENIAEQIKFDPTTLKSKLKECLEHDKVQLTEPPYFNHHDGSVGDLYPLAIKYSSELATFFNDVIDALEQLRKRQLPVQNYNEMAMAPPKITRDGELRRSLRTTSTPSAYLHCETPESVEKQRSTSFSKFDTRVTKSTTDLTKDNTQISDISPKNKSKKTKSRFGGVFKRGSTARNNNARVNSEFIASEVKLSQNEIVGIMHKIKNKEISEEDALDVIKKGVTKSVSCDGSSPISAHAPLAEANSIGYLLSKEAASAVKNKTINKSLKSSSSMKGRAPTAKFYTREDDMAQSSTSLLSSDSRSSLEISGDHSGSNVEEDRLSISSKNSPEIGKHGLFKKIRNSMRKKKGENGDLEKDVCGSPEYSDTALIPGNQSEQFFNPTNPASSETLVPRPPTTASSNPVNITVPPPPSTTPPPPPIDDDSPTLSHQTEDEFRERKPSLKIKSYPQNQDEVSKRRLSGNNKNSLKTSNQDADVSIITPTNTSPKLDSSFNFNQSSSNSNKVIPQIPPRPVPRKSTSDSSTNPIPAVPPRRRSKLFRAESTDRQMDEIVKEMNEIAANFDNLDVQNVSEPPENVADSKPIENFKKTPPDVATKTSPGWKKPVPPPRPNVHKERLDDTSSVDSRSTSSLDSKEGIQCQTRRVNKRNVRSIVSPKILISKKLRKDVIDIAAAPYTAKDGSWGVPYNLIIRYENELPYSTAEIIKHLDEIRLEDRKKINLTVIPYREKDLCMDKKIRPNYSLNDWLIYIGLPMFIEDFREAGITTIEELRELDANDIKYIGIFDDDHIKLLVNKVKTLFL